MPVVLSVVWGKDLSHIFGQNAGSDVIVIREMSPGAQQGILKASGRIVISWHRWGDFDHLE